MTIAQMQKVSDTIIASNIGYDQYQRWSFLDKKNKKIIKGKECDCSTSCGAIAYLGGYPVDLSGTFYTGNFASKLKATGLFEVIKFKNLAQVKNGDFVLSPGRHVVFVRSKSRWFSAEVDERGKASGGKEGKQGSRETRYRKPYTGTFKYIVRPIRADFFKGALLHDFVTGSKSYDSTNKKLHIAAPYDSKLYDTFMSKWQMFNRGIKPYYSAVELPTPPVNNHAFVVLGSGLSAEGELTSKFTRRLQLAVDAYERFPTSTILVSGGAPKKGVTEAAAGKAWLMKKGVPADKIMVETKSSSTIGNALNSVPMLRNAGITSYTLVSDGSHLRRALTHFYASKLKIETAENKTFVLSSVGYLAYKDKTVQEKTVTKASLDTIGKEVAYLLGLSKYYK